MDYPKSVPGVGLVGGKFVDENAAVGQQGSLVPSAWGNSVTDELLNLIRGAGGEPDEAVLNQLEILLLRNPGEGLRGMPFKSSAQQARSLADDAVMLTPRMLNEAFKGGNQSLLSVNSGFQRFPGGYVRQYGYANVGVSGLVDVTFPIPFPGLCLGASAHEVEVNPASVGTGSTGEWSRTGMRVVFSRNGAAFNAGGFCWEAWGV